MKTLRMIQNVKKQRIIAKNLKIKKTEIVLDIGSGSSPFHKSNLLLDKYPISIEHRPSAVSICLDRRSLIIGDAEDLPFLDSSIDVVISRHILEHLANPLKFISELKRVANRGYISTPSPFNELIHGGYNETNNDIDVNLKNNLHHGIGVSGHEWFVHSDDNSIYMTAKCKDLYDIYLLLGSFVKRKTDYNRKIFYKKNKKWLETELYWHKNDLNCQILKDISDEKRKLMKDDNYYQIIESIKSIHQNNYGFFSVDNLKRILYNDISKERLFDILACPTHKKKLERKNDCLICPICGEYQIINNIPVLLPKEH